MPHVYAIAVLKNTSSSTSEDESRADSVFLEQEFELSEFNFFLRGKAREMITFLVRVVIQRTERGSKNIVEEGDYRCHASVNLDGLACAVVTDKDYPGRVAFSLASLVLMGTPLWPSLFIFISK
jgi:synaptobrevin family protein YKT6